MNKFHGTETILSDENKLLKEKIKSLQSEVEYLKKNREFDDAFNLFLKIAVWFIILVCLYPFFRFGWLLLTKF